MHYGEDQITFLVQGSADDPYKVTFKREGSKIIARCTCTAAKNRLPCKHRLRILKGSAEGIVSDNIDDVAKVASWLPGSPLEMAIKDMEYREKKAKELEKPYKLAKEFLSQSRRELELIMEGDLPPNRGFIEISADEGVKLK